MGRGEGNAAEGGSGGYPACAGAVGAPEQHSLGQGRRVDGGTAQRCGDAYAFSYWEQRLVCAVSHLLKSRCAEVEQTAYCVASLLVVPRGCPLRRALCSERSWGASSFPASPSQVFGWKHAAPLPSCSFCWNGLIRPGQSQAHRGYA